MPWRIESMLRQRSQFVLELQSGEQSLSELCRKFKISRTTGYKWKDRFELGGLTSLADKSRRPLTTTKRMPYEVATQIVAYRQAHASWGATKIRKILLRSLKDVPSRRTIHRVLQDCNFITTRRRHNRRKVQKRTVLKALYCNHVWTVDFKGWWRTKDGKKVFPLTIRDEYSKMVLAIELCARPTLDCVKEAFIRCFERYGLPEYVRSDNGSPFSFSQGLCGLSRLSAWWIKLGIIPNFIPPASPQFNPGHERMHRDMADDMQRTPARNLSQQQTVADEWRYDFNYIRPHDSLQDRTPSQVYKPSKTKYKLAEPALEYPVKMIKRFVNRQGKFKYNGRTCFLSKAIGRENIGLDFTPDGQIDVWFGTALVARYTQDFSKFQEYDLITEAISEIKRAA